MLKAQEKIEGPLLSSSDEGFLRTISEHLPVMVTVYDVRSMQYLYANLAIKKVLGYSPDDFIKGGLDFASSLVHPDDIQKVIAKNNAALEAANKQTNRDAANEPIINFEYRMRHAKGHWVWLRTDGIVLSRGAGGKVELVLNVSFDITKHKIIEQNLRQITEQLVELNKSKDEFIAITSHQLRTPATGVKQYLALLLEGYADPLTKNQKVFLDRAYENNEWQLRVVDELLRIAQLDLDKVRLHSKPTDIGELLKTTINCMKEKFSSRRQKVELLKPKAPVIVPVDKDQLRMALENLIQNASNYSEEGKKITIKLNAVQEDQLKIIIKDQGVGINSSDIPKLFQKFSRINNSLAPNVNGTGLGLYFAKKIIELHGGKIALKSVVGKGSSFIVTLPK